MRFRRYRLLPQVDDLDDIGALEEYIGRSQMILFFLSKGYFRSKAIMPPRTPLNGHSYAPEHMAHHLFGRLAQNCLREVRSSLSMRKPLVLVQEAHPAKGGTLEELRAECPEDLQAAVFDADWRRRKLAVWHRVEEFQLVSLKIIAEARSPACADDLVLLHRLVLR